MFQVLPLQHYEVMQHHINASKDWGEVTKRKKRRKNFTDIYKILAKWPVELPGFSKKIDENIEFIVTTKLEYEHVLLDTDI